MIALSNILIPLYGVYKPRLWQKFDSWTSRLLARLAQLLAETSLHDWLIWF